MLAKWPLPELRPHTHWLPHEVTDHFKQQRRLVHRNHSPWPRGNAWTLVGHTSPKTPTVQLESSELNIWEEGSWQLSTSLWPVPEANGWRAQDSEELARAMP